tara:strand:- start:66 stop:254 length:189 start_codon:yes stop_codon:yes gene_type:complete
MGFLADLPVTLVIGVLWIVLTILAIYFEDEEKFVSRVEFYMLLLGIGIGLVTVVAYIENFYF